MGRPPRSVEQSEFTPDRGNALQACAASILDLPLKAVPNFVASGTDYWRAMLAHASSLQLSLLKVGLDEQGRLPNPTTEGTLCFLRGTSPRGPHGHVVVASVGADGRTLEPAHDPHPDGTFLAPPLSWAAFYVAAAPHRAAVPALAAVDTPEQRAARFCERITPSLAAAGFDVSAPLLAGWYNEHPKISQLPAAHHLDAEASTPCLLIGNSRALWGPFVRWIGAPSSSKGSF